MRFGHEINIPIVNLAKDLVKLSVLGDSVDVQKKQEEERYNEIPVSRDNGTPGDRLRHYLHSGLLDVHGVPRTKGHYFISSAFFALVLFYWTGISDPYVLSKVISISLLLLVWLNNKLLLKIPATLSGPLSALALIVLLSAALSPDPLVSLLGSYGAYYSGVLSSFIYLALFFLSVGEDQDFVLDSLIVFATLAGLIGCAQKLGFFLPYPLAGGRVMSTLGSPVYLSGLFALSIPLTLYRKRYAFLAPQALCLLLTLSRGGVLGAACGCVIAAAQRWGDSKKFLYASTVLTILGTLCVFGIGKLRPSSSKSDSGRLVMADVASRAIRAYPILGYGPDTFHHAMVDYRTKEQDDLMGKRWSNDHSHNIILNSLATTGLLGFLSLAFLVFRFFSTANLVKPLLPGLIGLGIYSMVQPLPFCLKGVLAMLCGSAYTHGKESRTLTYAFRLAIVPVLLVVSSMTYGARLHYDVMFTYNKNLFDTSLKYFPTMYR